MLDRGVVKEFLEEKLKDAGIEIPQDINFDELVETFCLYTENDYYEWLKDNYKSYFSIGNIGLAFNWDGIRERIEGRRKSGELRKPEAKLTKGQREKLEDWYARHIFETIEWHDDSILFSICKEGLTCATEIDDEDLIKQYKEYADRENIPEKDMII
ncbi:hypothetical protein KAX08_03925 [candidate division WOR-3 bacterium]|nr:hypothetical protein [candidate division WOR-3 bacterium]